MSISLEGPKNSLLIKSPLLKMQTLGTKISWTARLNRDYHAIIAEWLPLDTNNPSIMIAHVCLVPNKQSQKSLLFSL